MLEGNDNTSYILTNHYKTRQDAGKNCYLATQHLGYKLFGARDNGMCVSPKEQKIESKMLLENGSS